MSIRRIASLNVRPKISHQSHLLDMDIFLILIDIRSSPQFYISAITVFYQSISSFFSCFAYESSAYTSFPHASTENGIGIFFSNIDLITLSTL